MLTKYVGLGNVIFKNEIEILREIENLRTVNDSTHTKEKFQIIYIYIHISAIHQIHITNH